MSNKVIFHEFNPVIYPLKVWIVKNPTKEATLERFEHHDGVEITHDVKEGSIAGVYNRVLCEKSTGNYGILISIFSSASVSNIAHEATHAARYIWNWIGEYDPALEADAYLVGWIADCMWQVKTGKFKNE